MKVYRVVEYHYEGDATTLGTFDSLEKAEKCKAEALEEIRIHEVPIQ